jgi:hypothetical protein
MPSFYRCENEFGGDPCKYAKDGYKIPHEKTIQSMDDGSVLLCPGKKESGKDCRSKLIPLPDITPWWKKILPAVGGILVVAVLFIWFFTKGSDSSDDAQSQGITSGSMSSPAPVNVTPPPESRDPWWVYQQLETSSKILRTEP